MISLLAGWKGAVDVNGKHFSNINEIAGNLALDGKINIKLYPVNRKSENEQGKGTVAGNTKEEQEVVITVKKYMTKKSENGFDFMLKWNKDVPMPLRTMVGYKVKETPGMVYMKLHGDILAERTFTCMCCGRKLTNPVSQYFGIGPECGSHNYVNPFNSDEELKQAVDSYRKKLQEVTWEGWIIKSAIQEEVPYEKCN